jgi:hypothetical protein
MRTALVLLPLTALLTATPAAVAAPTQPGGSSAAGAVTDTSASSAAAAPATVGLASSTPLPTVQVDGAVWAQTTVGNTVYAVGKFSNARPAGAAAGTNQTPRGNILAYDIRTGALITSFNHTLNAQALAITASPDGSVVYVGGQFTQVDGQNRYRIAAFSTATGALLPYAPAPNATVQAISVTSTTVYLGGVFTVVNGNARMRLAATTTSGALLAWAPTATATVRGIVATPQYGRVYLGGSFSTVNGTATSGVSAVNSATGATITVPVSRDIIATSNNSSGAGIYDLRTDGTRIYGGGYNAISPSYPQFEGTFGMDPATGTVQWVNDCWGDTYDTVPIAGELYVASHVHSCAGAGFFNDTGQHFFGTAFGTTATSNHNVRDGRGWDYSRFPTSSYSGWQPPFQVGPSHQAVWSFSGNSAYVSAGGDFPGIGKLAQQGLARFAISTTAAAAAATPGASASTATTSGAN